MKRAAMERLDFQLPDFTRVSWTDDQARAVWEVRFAAISAAWKELEILSVANGLRQCGLVFVASSDLAARSADWLKAGLTGLPLTLTGLPQGYTATPPDPASQLSSYYRVVVGTAPDVLEFKEAYDKSDEVTIGRLLGYPVCCSNFFKETWVGGRLIDTTWPMALATAGAIVDANSVTIEAGQASNILWRWIGLRSVPHLPCSFACSETERLGRRIMQVGKEAGCGPEMDWLWEILSWPVEWSALHGIAEIKMPILKIATRTDATAIKYTVKLVSNRYPAEGARGVRFPYKTDTPRPQPKRPVKDRAAEIRSDRPEDQEWYSKDNGFVTRAAMNRAHLPLVRAASSLLAANADPAQVLDLGCGNGALLGKIAATRSGIVPFGIDRRLICISNARQLLPGYCDNLFVGDFFESEDPWPAERHYALVILMIGRLFEVPFENSHALRQRLKTRASFALLYTYDADLLKWGGEMPALAVRMGMPLLCYDANANFGLVRFR